MSTNNGNGKSTIVNFVFNYDTKGAIRYQEVDANGHPVKTDADGALISSVYLRKLAARGRLGEQVPQKLRVEITAV